MAKKLYLDVQGTGYLKDPTTLRGAGKDQFFRSIFSAKAAEGTLLRARQFEDTFKDRLPGFTGT